MTSYCIVGKSKWNFCGVFFYLLSSCTCLIVKAISSNKYVNEVCLGSNSKENTNFKTAYIFQYRTQPNRLQSKLTKGKSNGNNLATAYCPLITMCPSSQVIKDKRVLRLIDWSEHLFEMVDERDWKRKRQREIEFGSFKALLQRRHKDRTFPLIETNLIQKSMVLVQEVNHSQVRLKTSL